MLAWKMFKLVCREANQLNSLFRLEAWIGSTWDILERALEMHFLFCRPEYISHTHTPLFQLAGALEGHM